MTERKDKKKLDRSVVWREAREIIWVYRRRVAFGLLVMVVGRLAAFVAPASSKFLIDEVFTNARAELLPWLALAVGVAAVVQAGCTFALSQILGVTAQRAITEMRKAVEQHVTRLPIRYFDDTKSGVLISRIMTDAEGIRNLVGTGLVQLIGGLFTAVVAFFVLLFLNWQLTLYTVAILAGFGGAMAFAFSRLRPLFRERGRINAEVTGRLGETLSGVRIIKAFTSERREDLVFAKGAHRLFRNVATAVTGVSAITSFSAVITGLVGIGMILVGGRAVLDATMTLGDFVMFVFFTGLMVTPLVQMANIGTQISDAFAGLDRIREIRSMATEDEEDEDRARLRDLRGSVRFEDVHFSYDEGVPVLRGVSFEAPAGTTTALVGSSGSGKSTLVSLVLSFMRPTEGTIYVDGHDLSDVRMTDYRKHLAVVLQENFLFDDSILENIRYGRRDAPLEEVRRAAEIAHCHEFIQGFPDGYETIIGERGVKLSGGQRQRIAIARSILADPRILVMDEATSSLDSESEALIQEGLRFLMEGRTTFVIAHRLSTIRGADQILVVEDGEIVESGTHEELLARDGRYRELYDKQYAAEANRFINPGEEFDAAAVPS